MTIIAILAASYAARRVGRLLVTLSDRPQRKDRP